MITVENLEVYKRAHKFTLEIYRIATNFPKDETYGLSSQIKRAASSINANLMEGAARNTNKEYKQFIGIARGSAAELIYHLTLVKDLKFIDSTVADDLIDEVRQITRMLNGLQKSIPL